MSNAGNRNRSGLIIGIGLVLIGLLAGILGMLWLRPSGVPMAQTPRVVERVQLGSDKPAAHKPVEDPEAMPAVSVDPVLLNRLFHEVASRVTPTVVYIQVISTESGLPNDWFHNFDEEGQRRFFRRAPRRQSVGSGVIVSDEGYIVTNYHVVENAEDIQVTLSDKRVFPAEVTGVDPSTDMAVIKIDDADQLPVIEIGDSDDVDVGEWVLAVGNPFRLTSTVTAGIVSALGRQVNIIDDRFSIEDFIQTDAAINPGNSGGAVVNLQGQLVGIASAIATEGGSYEGYGFAVPSDLMQRIASDLIAYGEVRRGYLGVSIQEVNAEIARQLGMDGIAGVLVSQVQQGGAADRAGLENFDVVLAVDGHEVNAANELQSAVARRRPGEHVGLEVWRRGDRKKLDVELLGSDDPAYADWLAEDEPEQPPQQTAPSPHEPDAEVVNLAKWGLGVRDVTFREKQAFDVETGAYVAYVERGSVAARGGVRRDVVLTEVAGEPVETTEDVLRVLGSGIETETVLVGVKRRDGLTAYYEVEVPSE